VEQDRAPNVLPHHGQLERTFPVSREVVVNLIASTMTRQGLKIKAGLDENRYEAGIRLPDDEMAALSIEPAEFHGEWNCRINPQTSST
jgi:hypothetical protein